MHLETSWLKAYLISRHCRAKVQVDVYACSTYLALVYKELRKYPMIILHILRISNVKLKKKKEENQGNILSALPPHFQF